MSRVLLAVDGANLMMRGLHGAKLWAPERRFLPGSTAPRWPEELPGVVASMLQRILRRDTGVTDMVVALDCEGPCFRYHLHPGYKAGRAYGSAPSPSDLAAVVAPWLRAWGVATDQVEGFEADDVLATLAQRCVTHGTELDVLTRDEDLLQVVEPGVRVLWPEPGKKEDGRPREETAYDAALVQQRTGVRPAQIPDWKALSGCASDGIPKVGLPREGKDGKVRTFGFTPVRAAELLARHDCLEGVFMEMDQLPEKEQAWLEACRQQAYVMRTVARLRRDVPLGVEPAATNINRIDWDAQP
jgi:DNA polymerase-1